MYQTRIITDESQVPEGYVRMADIAVNHGEKFRRLISTAHAGGKLPAVKIMRTLEHRSGDVFLEREAVEKFIRDRMESEGRVKNFKTLSDIKRPDEGNAVLQELREIRELQQQTVDCLKQLLTVWGAN